MGKGCGCSNANQSAKPIGEVVKQNMAAMQQSKETPMSDEQMVLISYNHPNRGQHVVKGMSTGTYYGYRSGGERFLAHRADIALQPHIMVPVEQQQAKVNEPAPPPQPTFDATAYLAQIRSKWQGDLDLQTLPGVTAQVAVNMQNSGFTTRDAILGAGAETLADAVKGLGQIKAEAIVAYLESVNAD